MKRIISILLCVAFLLLSLTACKSEIDGGSNENKASDELSDQTVQVVRLRQDVKKGERLTRKHVELAEISASVVSDEFVTDINKAISRYAKYDLCDGDYIYASQISKDVVSKYSSDMFRQEIAESQEDFIVVSDYLKPNTGEDVYSYLQNIIDSNPGRTIYFPDGEYVISSSLVTSSAGAKSTTFFLSDNAVLKASDDWKKSGNALIHIGKLTSGGHVNDSSSNGSYFGVIGGVLDGNGLSRGISIDSSRESFIYGVQIKNTTTGIIINKGANNGSADADIENVDIIGNGLKNSVGIAICGMDNTVTNVKIYDMQTGVYAEMPGNAFRNIDIYFSEDYENYEDTVGFHQSAHADFLFDCYVENAAVAYKLSGGYAYILDSLGAGWTYAAPTQTAFDMSNGFYSYMSNCNIAFYDGSTKNTFIKGTSGDGRIDMPILNTQYENNGSYKKFLTDRGVIDLSLIGS